MSIAPRPASAASPAARWLTPDQQRVWRTYLLGVARLDEYLDADLRKHGLDLGEYEILVCLEEVEDDSCGCRNWLIASTSPGPG